MSLYPSPAICFPINTDTKYQNLLKVYHIIVPSEKWEQKSATSIILPAF